MEALARDLRDQVVRSTLALRALSDGQAGRPRSAGRWSPKQILGHLIDSASNNHGRFVRAQEQQSLVFPGYDQDRWGAIQRHAQAPWLELVTLWEALNLQLARVVEAVPEEVAQRSRAEHSLDRIAWEPVPHDEPTTLAYFMRDYLGHLQHHLRQIDPDLAPEPMRQREHSLPRPAERRRGGRHPESR